MTGIIGAMKIEVESIAASMTYKRERIISGNRKQKQDKIYRKRS